MPDLAQRMMPAEAESLLDDFQTDRPLTPASYEQLFRYFLEGFAAYRSPDGANVEYPGLHSWSGRRSDRLEGFARLMPLLAAWRYSGRPTHVSRLDGTVVDLEQIIRAGLLAGTDPCQRAYWGRIGNYDQRIVEAADIALCVWLCRDSVWRELSSDEQRRVGDWLSLALRRRVWNNGWHLLIPFIGAVLRGLGFPVEQAVLQQHYQQFKSFYLGDGWFGDGPKGTVDYYNAWHVHYLLFWLQQVDPGWDSAFITAARGEFLRSYRYLLGPQGVPLMGRSICYRLATPAPLIIGHLTCPEQTSAGEARRALDAVWRYFIRHGAVAHGCITQGYHQADPRILEFYSGPASPLWSLRSLVVALLLAAESPFWRTTDGKLPVEQGDYAIAVPATGWSIRGRQAGHVIEIEMPGGRGTSADALQGYGSWRQAGERWLRIPCRPNNTQAKYGRKIYSSAWPLGVPCNPDASPSRR